MGTPIKSPSQRSPAPSGPRDALRSRATAAAVGVGLLAAALATGARVVKTRRQSNREALLDELFTVARAGQGALPVAAQRYRDRLSPGMAADARSRYRAAARDGDGETAGFWADVSRTIYGALGMRAEALLGDLDVMGIFFMAASTPAQYSELRGTLLRLRAAADGAGLRGAAFAAGVSAAKCAYHGALAAQGAMQSRLLSLALDDVLDCAERLAGPQELEFRFPGDFDDFVWVMAAVTGIAMNLERGAHAPDADARLRRLAKLADTLVPPDFEYEVIGLPDAAQRTTAIAETLAALSARYG